jgi:hypothetical protein
MSEIKFVVLDVHTSYFFEKMENTDKYIAINMN